MLNITDYVMWFGATIFGLWQLELIVKGDDIDYQPGAAALSEGLGAWLFIWIAAGFFLFNWWLFSATICAFVLWDVLHPVGFNKVTGHQTPSRRLEVACLCTFATAAIIHNPF